MLKKIGLTLLGLVVLLGVLIGGMLLYVSQVTASKQQQTYAVSPPDISEAIAQGDVQLGERIVKVRNGCTDCHGTDLAGHKVMDNGAMGTIYGANITPATTRAWTDTDWVKAIRHGLNRENRALVLMPSHEYTALSEKDLGAVIAYLKSIPAVDKPSVPVVLGPVAKGLLAFEKAPSFLAAQVIDHQKPFAQKPIEAADADFGAYLAQSSCSGCHGPAFRGGPIPGGAPDWPPAADLTQLKGWDLNTFSAAVTTGKGAQGQDLKAPMPHYSFNAQEVEALWKFFTEALPTLNPPQ